MNLHGKAILHALLMGIAGVAPRSALPNLIELLALIALKRALECREWMKEILFSVRLCNCFFDVVLTVF
jgi:importin-13